MVMTGKAQFKSKKTNIAALKKSWEIGIIILINILIIAIAVSPAFSSDIFSSDSSVQTYSAYGSRGDEVRNIQKKLKALGMYNGSIDGVYGLKTKSSVKYFQKSRGLKADGIAGSKTLLYLGITSGGSSGSSQYNNSDYNLLARLISAEARGEPYTGQVAVGAVVLNRVQHASFPDTIAGVIYQPGAFSCMNDGNWNETVSASSKKAAMDCLNGWDPSGGSIYYYNPAKTTNKSIRSRPVVKVIGSHYFAK